MAVVVLLGPPGAGKGTQAGFLARAKGLVHVSTGELLRQAIASGSELGSRVKETVEAGRLVDDELIAAIVGRKLDETGGRMLLDGFPRTVRQAELLAVLLAERGLPPVVVVEIGLDESEVIRRLTARRTCASCGPRQAGEVACAGCGGPLTTRPDDTEPVIKERLRVYSAQTAPLSSHYSSLGQLRPVDGSAPPDEVARRVAEAVADVG